MSYDVWRNLCNALTALALCVFVSLNVYFSRKIKAKNEKR